MKALLYANKKVRITFIDGMEKHNQKLHNRVVLVDCFGLSQNTNGGLAGGIYSQHKSACNFEYIHNALVSPAGDI